MPINVFKKIGNYYNNIKIIYLSLKVFQIKKSLVKLFMASMSAFQLLKLWMDFSGTHPIAVSNTNHESSAFPCNRKAGQSPGGYLGHYHRRLRQNQGWYSIVMYLGCISLPVEKNKENWYKTVHFYISTITEFDQETSAHLWLCGHIFFLVNKEASVCLNLNKFNTLFNIY